MDQLVQSHTVLCDFNFQMDSGFIFFVFAIGTAMYICVGFALFWNADIEAELFGILILHLNVVIICT